jgi:hypothetical protein
MPEVFNSFTSHWSAGRYQKVMDPDLTALARSVPTQKQRPRSFPLLETISIAIRFGTKVPTFRQLPHAVPRRKSQEILRRMGFETDFGGRGPWGLSGANSINPSVMQGCVRLTTRLSDAAGLDFGACEVTRCWYGNPVSQLR